MREGEVLIDLVMGDTNLPFKPGDLGEARSFQSGFRGAWFRCKIKDISKRKGVIGHVSEYFDFPGEKLKWAKLYQVPPYHPSKKTAGRHRELMLRPPYPPVIKESETSNETDISDVAVIIKDAWRVGHMVDWWYSGCFWCGKIIELSGDDKVKIELLPTPLGEGSTYDGLLSDVRPSLDWSPEHGWTIPSQDYPPCARIHNPKKENTVPGEAEEEATVGNISGGEHETNSARKPQPSETDAGDNHPTSETPPLNSIVSDDPLAASVMGLVECLNKVKRLKAMLRLGVEPSSGESNKGKWEYVQRGNPSTTQN